jgi:hypothetical protein
LKVNKIIVSVIASISLLVSVIGVFTPVLSKYIKNVGTYRFSSGVSIQGYDNSLLTILILLLTIAIAILSISSLILTIVDRMAANKQASAQYTTILYALNVTSMFSLANLFKKENIS